MSLTRARYLAYLRERWAKPDLIEMALAADSPLFGLLEKVRSGGKYYHVPILQTGAQGRSATFATAVTNAVGSQTRAFDVTYVSNYGILQLEGDIINDSEGNENALFSAVDHEVKAGLANMAKDMRVSLYGATGGAKGVVGSHSTVNFTLANIEDAIHFEVGMLLTADTVNGGGTVHAGQEAITAINRDTGVLTAAQDWSTGITGFAANDFVFEEGDYDGKLAGLESWIPTSAPGATTFYGVNRSRDTVRLGGVRYDGTTEPLEEACQNAAGVVQLYSGKITHFFANPIKWAQFANSISADSANRKTVVEGSTSRGAKVGYDAIMVATPVGMVPLLSDPGCPRGYIMGLDMDTWTLPYSGPELIHIVDDDGLEMRRGSGDDWQVDLKCRCNLACNAPGRNVRIAVE
jgi:hypothetical protein